MTQITTNALVCENKSVILSLGHQRPPICQIVAIAARSKIHVDNGNDSKARDFMNLLNSMDFTQHITEPTHNHGHTLDLVITKGLTTVISSVCDLALSDHFCIFFEALVPKVKNRSECFIRKRYLNSAAAENFKVIMNITSTKTPDAG